MSKSILHTSKFQNKKMGLTCYFSWKMIKTGNLRAKFDKICVFSKHVCVWPHCTRMYHAAISVHEKGGMWWYQNCACEWCTKIIVESCKQNQLLSVLLLRNPLATESWSHHCDCLIEISLKLMELILAVMVLCGLHPFCFAVVPVWWFNWYGII